MTKILGMAMFLRAYVLLHLARCFNPIYIHRALIQKIPGCLSLPHLPPTCQLLPLWVFVDMLIKMNA